MRTIVHLSDIHFGREDPPLVEAVLKFVSNLRPQISIVSGDFTQRAKREEYIKAQRFFEALPGHKIAVPGNHDIPLWNVFARFLKPLTKYRQYISDDLEPTYFDDEIAIIGINTARSFTRANGRINKSQADRVVEQLKNVSPGVLKIVVTHHPFDLAETFGKKMLVGRARMAMERLEEGGAEILLAGHWHEAYTGGTAKRYPIKDYSALIIQAGTATSVRRRLSSNSFNVLRYDKPFLTVDVMSWDKSAERFILLESRRFERKARGGFEPREDELKRSPEADTEAPV